MTAIRAWSRSAGTASTPDCIPSQQVRGYCDYLVDFLPALHRYSDPVAGAAYLHNATEHGIAPLRQMAESAHARLFTGERRGEFLAFLRSRLASDVAGAPYADEFLSARAAPSRQLLSVAAAEIREREQFVLLDQQQLAYNIVLHATEAARRGDSKTVVVVTGGPGSGKSVIALSLLGELARRGHTVLHATGSRSFTQTLRKVAGRGSTRTQSLFKYFNQFMDADRNGLEVLILDEAHRIRETSADRYTQPRREPAARQIDELIAAARVPVFLLDEHQVVRPGEMGSVEDIEAHALKAGSKIAEGPAGRSVPVRRQRGVHGWVTACSAFALADRLPGSGSSVRACRSLIARTNWSTCCVPRSAPDMERGSRRATAGRGAILGRTARSRPTS